MDKRAFERTTIQTSAVIDADGKTQAMVTISSAEYRELCGKAALWDSYSADVERWAGDADA